MIFSNRTAVITGAAGRIGCALAKELGQAGVKLVLADRDPESLQKAAAMLQKEGISAYTCVMDVTDSDSVARAAADVLQKMGKVDILVNNAGNWPRTPFLEMEEAQWQKVIDLNLTGVFRVTKAFAPGMIAQKYGRILNLGSIAGEAGLPGYSAYSVSKAGVIMLTKVLAMEFAKANVTVNCVSPGLIEDTVTPNAGTWLGHCGTGGDVARVIAMLCADDGGYVTGVDYTVDGGRILGPHNAQF